jgi:hypothetical protein
MNYNHKIYSFTNRCPLFHYFRIPSFHEHGGTYEKERKGKSVEGGIEEKKCEKFVEEIER